ncbi:hypothetical protein ABPG74_012952 [Tetrahymena malaccensis]
MIRLLFLIAVLAPQIICFEIINVSTLVNGQNVIDTHSLLANINLGTPPQDIQVMLYFGNDLPNLGQFIFDKSVQGQYSTFDILQEVFKIKSYYDLNSSSTSQIKGNYESNQEQKGGYGERMHGKYVQDIMQIGKIKFNYQFACSQQIVRLNQPYSGGLIFFQKTEDNIFDLMYKQKAIKTADYVLQGSTQIIDQNYNVIGHNLKIIFDLESNSKYYNSPSNQLVANSDLFQMYCYGIYLDGEDISDKIKYRKVQVDQFTNSWSLSSKYIKIPSDLYLIITTKYQQLSSQIIFNCNKCQCKETQKLPVITLITQEYKLTIDPSSYLDEISFDGSCQVNLFQDTYFNFASNLLFNRNIQIMYSKQSNSVRLIGADTIKHMNIEAIKYIFPIFTALILAGLLFTISWSIYQIRNIKLEYIKLKEKLNISLKL